MTIDINEIGNIESNYHGFTEQEPFSLGDNPDYVRMQEEECPECGKTFDECKCFSPCCGAPIVFGDICSECQEHC